MTESKYTLKQLGPDEFLGQVIDFVPDAGEVIFTPRIQEKGIEARDVCGDGTDEYRHNSPLALWDKFPIKYTYDQISISLQKGIDAAFVEINALFKASTDKLMFERTVNQAEANLVITINRIDVAGRVLAEARWWFNSRNIISRATITFDSAENWSYLDSESCGANGIIFDICNVAKHEIGHIIGLGHAPTDKLQTMYASTGPGQTLGRSFGNGDLKGFKLAYKLKGEEPQDNKPPVVQDITLDIESNEEIMIQLEAQDPEDDPLTYQIVAQPYYGKITLSESGMVLYTPKQDFVGTDSFGYRAYDDHDNVSNVGTVKLFIDKANKPPVAKNIIAETVQDEAIIISLYAEDPEGDAIDYEIIQEPAHGKLEPATAINQRIYIPDPGYAGIDKFSYVAIDDHENISKECNVTIVVKMKEPEPDNKHKLTKAQLIQIKTLRLIYEQFEKAGLKEQAAKAREELQDYIIEALIKLHS